MTTMRAKVRVSSVRVFESGGEELVFTPVAKNGPYPDDGADENNTYAKFSPDGEFRLSVQNPALFGKFEIGDTFYVDFSPAPK